MFDKIRAKAKFAASLTRAGRQVSRLQPIGTINARLFRNGRLIQEVFGYNGVTTVGKNHLLDVVFSSGSANATWYIGLIDNDSFSALLDADTLASHSGWSELIPGTDYTGNRLEWTEGSASGGSKTSSSDTTFPMLTTKTVYGILISSAASGTSGVLMATGAFDSTIDVINGDSLKVSYTITY